MTNPCLKVRLRIVFEDVPFLCPPMLCLIMFLTANNAEPHRAQYQQLLLELVSRLPRAQVMASFLSVEQVLARFRLVKVSLDFVPFACDFALYKAVVARPLAHHWVYFSAVHTPLDYLACAQEDSHLVADMAADKLAALVAVALIVAPSIARLVDKDNIQGHLVVEPLVVLDSYHADGGVAFHWHQLEPVDSPAVVAFVLPFVDRAWRRLVVVACPNHMADMLAT